MTSLLQTRGSISACQSCCVRCLSASVRGASTLSAVNKGRHRELQKDRRSDWPRRNDRDSQTRRDDLYSRALAGGTGDQTWGSPTGKREALRAKITKKNTRGEMPANESGRSFSREVVADGMLNLAKFDRRQDGRQRRLGSGQHQNQQWSPRVTENGPKSSKQGGFDDADLDDAKAKFPKHSSKLKKMDDHVKLSEKEYARKYPLRSGEHVQRIVRPTRHEVHERKSLKQAGDDYKARISAEMRESPGRDEEFQSVFSSSTLDPEAPSLPYATAASSFIYGRSAALACLRAKRRIVNKAWLSADRATRDGLLADIIPLLQERQVRTETVTRQIHVQGMEMAAGGRPHNGVVLDVSPLPYPKVQGLEALPPATSNGQEFFLMLGAQSAEERATNAALGTLITSAGSWRKPLVLFLDGVVDEGNMGNIIRTAYFYGIEAVAICAGTCAPVTSSVVAKAASGAVEVMPLLRVENENRFLNNCRDNGWDIWASVPHPDSSRLSPRGGRDISNRREKNRRQTAVVPALFTNSMTSPLVDKPAVLMLGSEGTGLRGFVIEKATGKVSISTSGRRDRIDISVDSMNVASATAVLLEAFLREPARLQQPQEQQSEQGRRPMGDMSTDGIAGAHSKPRGTNRHDQITRMETMNAKAGGSRAEREALNAEDIVLPHDVEDGSVFRLQNVRP